VNNVITTALDNLLSSYDYSLFYSWSLPSSSYDDGQGPCGGGPFCDHPSGPQQYFSTKLPTEIQFLGSRPAEIPVFVNFARCEVCTVSLSHHYCNSTLGYGRQVLMPTKKKNSPPADRLRLPAMAFCRWISTTKIEKKSLVKSLFSLCSDRFIWVVLVGLLEQPSRNRDCHGQHGHGGAILPNSKNM
jgi:hypothetical protein